MCIHVDEDAECFQFNIRVRVEVIVSCFRFRSMPV